MVVILKGFKKTEFTNDSGQKVSGTRLFYEYEDDTTQGVVCDSKYFDDNSKITLPDLQFNHKYEFCFDVSILNGKAKATLTGVKKLN